MRVLFLSATIALSALAVPGCGPSSCNPSERVITEGIRIESGPYREFQTSLPDGPYLPFEGGTTVHIRHQFGFVPSTVVIYPSFTERPLVTGKDGYSPAAGNQAIVLRHDDQEVAVWNGSCANYFVRIVISGVASTTDAALDATAADTSVSDAASDGG